MPPEVAIVALGIALTAGPLLFGGAFPWSVSVVAALAVSALLLCALAFARDNHAEVGVLFLAFFGPLAWTLIQSTPLPCRLVRAISPRAAEAADAAASLLDEPAVCTISLDPGASRTYLVIGAAILAAWLAGWLAATAGRRREVYLACAVAVLVLACVTFLHLVLGMEKVYGTYSPRFARPALLAPLLNDNHLGGFLAFGVPILFVIGLDSKRDRGRRLWWWVSAAFVASLTLMSLSRGAIAVLLGAIVLLPIALYQRRKRRGGQLGVARSVLGLGVVLAFGAALGGYAAGTQILGQLGREDTSKLDLVGKAMAFAANAPLVGYGRGALSSVFVSQAGTLGRYTHAEDFVAQWVADWGLVVALALIALLGRALLRAFRSTRALDLGVAVALLALTVHNLVDFSFEMVGVAIVPAAAFGALTAPDPNEDEQVESRRFSVPRVTGMACAVCVLLAIYPGAFVAHLSTQSLQDRLVHLSRSHSSEFASLLKEAVRLHPTEPAFPLLAGNEARVRDSPEALKWLNRAMELAPGWAAPHVETAYWLLDHHRGDQALLEIRAAASLDPASTEPIVCELMQRGMSADSVLRAAPRGDNRQSFLLDAGECLEEVDEATAAIDRVLIREHPELLQPRIRAAARALSEGDGEGAISAMRALVREHPEDPMVRRRMAELLISAGDPEAAIAATEEAEEMPLTRGERRALLAVRARAETRAHDLEGMRATITRLRQLSDGSPHYIAQALLLQASLEESARNHFRALHALEEANDVSPKPDVLERIARLAERTGNSVRAFQAYSELCALDPANTHYCREKQRLLERN